MTQMGITLFFLIIISVIALAMFVHAWIDKGRIRRNLEQLAKNLSGKVLQENRLIYPRFSGEVDGRQIELFFKIVKVGRKEILYYIYSLKSDITCSLLLLKADAFKPIRSEPEAIKAAGSPFSEIKAGYQLRSPDEAEAMTIFEAAAIQERLPALDEFSSLQLGPDALVVGKPYDGLSDTESTNIMKNIRSLVNLAKAMEQCRLPA